jgi:hypothetical protein
MFKDIQRGLEKFFTKERVLVIIVFLIFAWILFSYSDSKSNVYDGFYSDNINQPPMPTPSVMQNNAPSSKMAPVGGASSAVAPSYSMQPVANPGDLLPKDQNSQWSALNPNTMNQGNILIPDLLQAGYHIGLDTIGQTLRNANLQLRSDPIIPKKNVSPWQNSTIEPDHARIPLELGCGPQ